jgi:hypothetical protein
VTPAALAALAPMIERDVEPELAELLVEALEGAIDATGSNARAALDAALARSPGFKRGRIAAAASARPEPVTPQEKEARRVGERFASALGSIEAPRYATLTDPALARKPDGTLRSHAEVLEAALGDPRLVKQ